MTVRKPLVAEPPGRLRLLITSQVLLACSLTIALVLRLSDERWPWAVVIGVLLVACLAYLAHLVRRLRQLARTAGPRQIDQ